MSNEVKFFVGILLLLAALLYSPKKPDDVIKINKPGEDIIELVKTLPVIDDSVDSTKLAGYFMVVSQTLFDLKSVSTNINLQDFLSKTGTDSFGSEFKIDGQSKYPDFSAGAAKIITSVIGSQDVPKTLTKEDKESLSKLFYGFAWKLYYPENYDVYKTYREKALDAVQKYENPPKPDSECECKGTKKITHGDGHKTECPCINSNERCKYNCKGKSTKNLDKKTYRVVKKNNTLPA